ncbi:MAG TPA: AraC family transcriptional regulator [Bacilli bacterium]
MLKYIETRLHENITVDELAKLVHFHPNYFIHFFHKMTGSSPVQYINKQKVERAKQLLSATDLSVTEISERVGFQLYYSSKIFKKAIGSSPTAYRGFTNS